MEGETAYGRRVVCARCNRLLDRQTGTNLLSRPGIVAAALNRPLAELRYYSSNEAVLPALVPIQKDSPAVVRRECHAQSRSQVFPGVDVA